MFTDDKRLQQAVSLNRSRQLRQSRVGASGLEDVSVPDDEFVQRYGCNVSQSSPWLGFFRRRHERAARESALSSAGGTANTESWSRPAVDGARAAHAAA